MYEKTRRQTTRSRFSRESGQRIDARSAAQMRSSGVSLVQLSLDGTRPVHDRIGRRSGAFGQVLQGLRGHSGLRLHAYSPRFARSEQVVPIDPMTVRSWAVRPGSQERFGGKNGPAFEVGSLARSVLRLRP